MKISDIWAIKVVQVTSANTEIERLPQDIYVLTVTKCHILRHADNHDSVVAASIMADVSDIVENLIICDSLHSVELAIEQAVKLSDLINSRDVDCEVAPPIVHTFLGEGKQVNQVEDTRVERQPLVGREVGPKKGVYIEANSLDFFKVEVAHCQA